MFSTGSSGNTKSAGKLSHVTMGASGAAVTDGTCKTIGIALEDNLLFSLISKV
ncbi:MAG: hypothetical protein OHK0047_44770 [Leptolyngbyaceae cyanobacterium]